MPVTRAAGADEAGDFDSVQDFDSV